MLESSEPVEILDLRPHRQFERFHINGAHSLPVEQISAETMLNSRELLATEPIYLVSQNGALAHLCAGALEQRGFGNLVVVSGGMWGWQNEDLPVKIEKRGPEMIEAA